MGKFTPTEIEDQKAGATDTRKGKKKKIDWQRLKVDNMGIKRSKTE